MMFTRHPSYLPFELMASGCLVVTNFNPATTWLLKDGDNCLLAEASPTCLADTLEAGLLNIVKRNQITAAASRNIQTNYSNWNVQIEKIYQFMCAPKGSAANE
jgi:glycosyltransferase involved in cell wall biosynthesis